MYDNHIEHTLGHHIWYAYTGRRQACGFMDVKLQVHVHVHV